MTRVACVMLAVTLAWIGVVPGSGDLDLDRHAHADAGDRLPGGALDGKEAEPAESPTPASSASGEPAEGDGEAEGEAGSRLPFTAWACDARPTDGAGRIAWQERLGVGEADGIRTLLERPPRA